MFSFLGSTSFLLSSSFFTSALIAGAFVTAFLLDVIGAILRGAGSVSTLLCRLTTRVSFELGSLRSDNASMLTDHCSPLLSWQRKAPVPCFKLL